MIYWDRATLKSRAKEVLKKSYWMSLLVSLIVGIVGGGVSGGVNFTYSFNGQDMEQTISQFQNGGGEALIRTALPVFSAVALGAGLIGIAFSIFVSNIFMIGKDRYYTLCRYDSIELENIISGFKNGKYLDNVKTMFMMGLYVFLWTLLFIVPGIIKALQYSMVPYILAENPNLSTERALEISTRMTDGEKGEIFVLGLSFIGWYLLGALACGVGVLFVTPYAEATYAELYGALRYKAVQTGICDKTELGAEL